MNGLREKFRNKKGFTLIEMLIVVAIIAILIAISIPLVGSALEKARDNTDLANERAAKAEAAIVFLGVADGNLPSTGTFYYDADEGSLKTDKDGIKGYGQCTQAHEDSTKYGADAKGPHTTNNILEVTIATTGIITMKWVEAA